MSEIAKTCSNCILRVPEWKDVTAPGPLCSWFLKKLQLPKPIPPETQAVGCKNWKPGQTYDRQLLEAKNGTHHDHD